MGLAKTHAGDKKQWEVTFEWTLKDTGKANLLHVLEQREWPMVWAMNQGCALGVS